MAATIVGPVNQPPGSPGGLFAAINVTAAQAFKALPGILFRVCIVVVGSAGNLTLNDCATTGTASAANTILTVAFGSLTVGQVIYLEWPCGTGITLSAIPTGGQVSLSYT